MEPCALRDWRILTTGIRRELRRGAASGKIDTMTTMIAPNKERPLSLATAAALEIACPKCDAEVGEMCRTTSGYRASRPHDQRCQLATPAPDTAWAAERDQFTAQVRDLTERLEHANGSLSAASRNEKIYAAELQDLYPKLRAAQAERDDLEANLATARRACEAAQEMIKADTARVSDLERQLTESSARVPAAARPVVVKAGWERGLARRYLYAKFRKVPLPAQCNVAERWVAAMAAGDQAEAEKLMVVVEGRWAQVHQQCAEPQEG